MTEQTMHGMEKCISFYYYVCQIAKLTLFSDLFPSVYISVYSVSESQISCLFSIHFFSSFLQCSFMDIISFDNVAFSPLFPRYLRSFFSLIPFSSFVLLLPRPMNNPRLFTYAAEAVNGSQTSSDFHSDRINPGNYLN